MENPKLINMEEFDYVLPEERIAYHPLPERNQSKLLVFKNHEIIDTHFDCLIDFLPNNSVLVFNDSKVVHARLLVHNQTGAQIEIFCLEPLYPSTELNQAFLATGKTVWKCFVGNAKRWKTPIHFSIVTADKEVNIQAIKHEADEGTFTVEFEWHDATVTFADWIDIYGKMPLPPYIKRCAEKEDETRYQTIYAHHKGSVAAPTAGLHFSEKELQKLSEKNIPYSYSTLHVGAGTFKPVTAQYSGEHFMHREQVILEPDLIKWLLKYKDRKVIAVGTTVTRTLESLFLIGAKLILGLSDPFHVSQWEYYENPNIKNISRKEALTQLLHYLEEQSIDQVTASTQLMILPGYKHKITDGLITNFHQPQSTLLLLIASFLGSEWKKIYRHALEKEYRFLSYGDANLYLP